RPITSKPAPGHIRKLAVTRPNQVWAMDLTYMWRDNVFVERLWRSIKYEEVYLHAYKTVSEARAGIARYLNFYNTRRPHWHCCKVSDEAAFCLIQRPYISKTLLTR
ncbi:integrase core domain-containing protein, partial [Klebsiella pneumoniae]|uniref:integrase core domain-containing protein n=1 Tax=Klebsiella pneumoniae TaxID=573 RepID=UPI003D80AE81